MLLESLLCELSQSHGHPVFSRQAISIDKTI